MSAPVPVAEIEASVLHLRGQNVMLDADLAELYGVETRTLVRAMSRNRGRFPEDFMFQLNADEFAILRSQIGISRSWGGRRTRPYAFTEQGVAMLSSVLRSEQAVRVNVEIMRTFVRLRRSLASNEELSRRLDDLEKRYDAQFRSVFEAICQLMAPPETSRRALGFPVRRDESPEE
jgi:hypothetical protein